MAKKAKLNVSDKDSPYALIDKYFPERESYFYQNKDKFVEEYRGQETKTDIGNISPSEVTQLLLSKMRMKLNEASYCSSNPISHTNQIYVTILYKRRREIMMIH